MLLNTSNVSIYNVPTNELLFNTETRVVLKQLLKCHLITFVKFHLLDACY